MTRASAYACLSLAVLLATAAQCRAELNLDGLGRLLTVTSADGQRWLRLSSMDDIALYVADDPPSGLRLYEDSPFLAPRLSVTVDAGWGEHVMAHVMARADRGFDPGGHPHGDTRLDEYYLQADLSGSGRVRLRVGKFQTAFGAWVGRHLAWDNPLVTAPALYEDLLPITDAAAPAGLEAFGVRRDAAENKANWVPIVWGPSYATGASLSAALGDDFDLTVEVKNASLSSRPRVWDLGSDGFATDPTLTGRLGWQPRPDWSFGVSFSRGPYLQENAEPTLPERASVDDFDQTTFGTDLTYSLHHLQIWVELVRSRFEVPRVGDADVLAGFVEASYQLAPQIWIAARWNQSWFDEIAALDGPWDRDVRRAEVAIGYRYNAHLEGKLEYSLGDQAGRDTNGNRLLVGQLVLWF